MLYSLDAPWVGPGVQPQIIAKALFVIEQGGLQPPKLYETPLSQQSPGKPAKPVVLGQFKWWPGWFHGGLVRHPPEQTCFVYNWQTDRYFYMKYELNMLMLLEIICRVNLQVSALGRTNHFHVDSGVA
jgi:hypothetical protein